MDQRLSVRDQLEQGIRVIDLELASLIGSKYACPPPQGASSTCTAAEGKCVYKRTGVFSHCLDCCPFIVSHGTPEQAVGDMLGYTFPETVFRSIAEFSAENPEEVITLYLIRTHGNAAPPLADLLGRLNSTGLLPLVWNGESPGKPWLGSFPTQGAMRSAGKPVMVLSSGMSGWSNTPVMAGSHCNSSDMEDPGETCAGGTPCMEGWDAVSPFQLDPARAVLGSASPGWDVNRTLFFIENLSSRRGRADHSAKYWPLPNELHDAPFQAGGNPAQGAAAAVYSHIVGLEKAWAVLLKPLGMMPNVILVDFFNTTTPTLGEPSRTLLPNPADGLVKAVHDINAQRAARR
jgi:hypothetical protein